MVDGHGQLEHIFDNLNPGILVFEEPHTRCGCRVNITHPIPGLRRVCEAGTNSVGGDRALDRSELILDSTL